MAKKMSRTKSQRIAYWVVLVSFAAPLLYYLIQMVAGTFDTVNLLTMLQCVLGLVVLHLPDFLSEKLRFEIPSLLYVFYLVFLYCAIFLGEFYDMFNRVPFWDVILHCSSSLVSGFLGFMFVAILNKSEKVLFHLSPHFASRSRSERFGRFTNIPLTDFWGLICRNSLRRTEPCLSDTRRSSIRWRI